MQTRPADFSVFYQWRSAPLPPPHYWEYSIRLGPGPEGRMEVTPGYPSPHVPRWSQRFELYAIQLDSLFQVLVEQGLFDAGIAPASEVPVGSDSQMLVVTANGREYHVPAFAAPAQEAAAALLRAAVVALAPRLIRDTLRARRDAYAARPTRP